MNLEIIFVRHAQSCANINKIPGMHIFTEDPIITKYGVENSKSLGKKLIEKIKEIWKKEGTGTDNYYNFSIGASQMIRAQQTAHYMTFDEKQFKEKKIYILPYISEEGFGWDNVPLKLYMQKCILHSRDDEIYENKEEPSGMNGFMGFFKSKNKNKELSSTEEIPVNDTKKIENLRNYDHVSDSEIGERIDSLVTFNDGEKPDFNNFIKWLSVYSLNNNEPFVTGSLDESEKEKKTYRMVIFTHSNFLRTVFKKKFNIPKDRKLLKNNDAIYCKINYTEAKPNENIKAKVEITEATHLNLYEGVEIKDSPSSDISCKKIKTIYKNCKNENQQGGKNKKTKNKKRKQKSKRTRKQKIIYF